MRHPCLDCVEVDSRCEPTEQPHCIKVQAYVDGIGPAGLPLESQPISKVVDKEPIKNMHNNQDLETRVCESRSCVHGYVAQPISNFKPDGRCRGGLKPICNDCLSKTNTSQIRRSSPSYKTKEREIQIVDLPDNVLDQLAVIAEREMRDLKSQICYMIKNEYQLHRARNIQ